MSRISNQQHKVKIITSINEKLTKSGQLPLSTEDFEVLYDLDVDELMNARFEIEQQLEKLKELKRA